ncbi:peptide chain release factor N(5)-glutamine methyltransferase [Salibacteraceae bacterium]|nr:peptide chain release factor N(5)-glutamine methyltransferase [Salibacteraceae bacterium]MDB0002648.1 peptide chain release factor N(5)-glutamine methyltransferase [Salibacteraceae bacterium]MDB4105648.1 peptide chain release factor N(5)-glutamine methyltransferase [Salibacteraceae bacterium]MDC1304926.1 peptide chain release factor N(5)-glutamine methyltransferase [Salibacteraceae bacterium]
MTHAELRQTFYQALTSTYLQGELLSLYHWCVEELEGWSKTQAYLKNDNEVSDESLRRWKEVITRLQTSEPVQYIFNKAHFGDLELYVDPSVLIPRPETEELVMLLLENEEEANLSVLDIGTGSGCIPLAIKNQRKGWKVSGCDISDKALAVAHRNAEVLKMDLHFFNADALDSETPLQKADVYISNPPYIPEKARSEMAANVLSHEPHLALFAPPSDPLAFYKTITTMAVNNSVKRVYFETHATDMKAFISEMTKIWSGEVVVKKDMAGKDRFVVLK